MPCPLSVTSTIYFNLPSNINTTTWLVGVGLVTYAKYKGCDPRKSGRITKMDQLVPLLVMGGLFISCVFSAALSTVSSGINALALIHLEDIAKPIYKSVKGTAMTDRFGTVISKLLAMFFGLLTVGLAFLAGILGRTMLHITLSSFGMTGGPLLGLFLLAIFIPFANTPGAVAGLLTSLLFSFWIAIGSIVSGSSPRILNITTTECDITPAANMSYFPTTSMASLMVNYTVALANTTSPAIIPTTSSLSIYRLSYMWYSGFSVVVALVVGIVVSLITGGLRGQEVNPNLVINVWKKVKSLMSRDKQEYVLADDHAKLETHSLPESVHLK